MLEVEFEPEAQTQLAELKQQFPAHAKLFDQVAESIGKGPEYFPAYEGVRRAGNHEGNGAPRTTWYFMVDKPMGKAVVVEIEWRDSR